MFNHAEAAEFIARSPCRHIRLPSAELAERPALDADQLSAVAAGLGDHGAMVWLGAVLGLRWGEVAGLTVGDIDFLRGEVVVKRQLGRDRRLSEPKSTAGRRRIATPQWLLDELSALLAARRLTAADADGSLAMFVVFALPGYAMAVWWMDRIGHRKLQLIGFSVMAAAFLVLAAVPVLTASMGAFLAVFGLSYFFV